MNTILEECRWLYNHLLGQRRTTYEATGKGLSLYDQNATLPDLKLNRLSLTTVHSQVLQNVAVRIDLAFKTFFRRVKAGETSGYPRFRGEGRYDSFCYPQYPSGCTLKEGAIYLSKIGEVKLVQHRSLEGKPKTVCVRRASTGKWFVTISCEVELKLMPQSNVTVGIDVGLNSFATLSTGEKIDNPRFFRHDERALAKAQRSLSKEEKGTPGRAKSRKVVSRIHERIASRRDNFVHQESRRIVNRFSIICVEDLTINRMVGNHCLAKSISDAAWGKFFECLAYKAEEAGRQFVKVNPAYTSQTCSGCGYRQKLSLSDRIFCCPTCNLNMDRDHNAARNMNSLGLQTVGLAPRSHRAALAAVE